MASVDYRAYIQAEIEEKDRLADIYSGADTDKGDASEHLTIEHLNLLLSKNIPRELRAMYLQEYADIRASIRAVALVGLRREDFYTHAAQMALSDKVFLSNSLIRNSTVANYAKRGILGDEETKFNQEEVEYVARKSEVIDRLKNETGSTSEKEITDEDIVRNAMKEHSASNRGVSTGKKRIS